MLVTAFATALNCPRIPRSAPPTICCCALCAKALSRSSSAEGPTSLLTKLVSGLGAAVASWPP
eukprot:11514676-Alexandrium_andersonii.AAC.1